MMEYCTLTAYWHWKRKENKDEVCARLCRPLAPKRTLPPPTWGWQIFCVLRSSPLLRTQWARSKSSSDSALVEHRGFEPLTSTMRTLRATICANAPNAFRNRCYYKSNRFRKQVLCALNERYILNRLIPLSSKSVCGCIFFVYMVLFADVSINPLTNNGCKV